jgi:hypothetical protein
MRAITPDADIIQAISTESAQFLNISHPPPSEPLAIGFRLPSTVDPLQRFSVTGTAEQLSIFEVHPA